EGEGGASRAQEAGRRPQPRRGRGHSAQAETCRDGRQEGGDGRRVRFGAPARRVDPAGDVRRVPRRRLSRRRDEARGRPDVHDRPLLIRSPRVWSMPKNKQPKPTPDIRVMFQLANQVEGPSESVILMAGDEREAVMHVMSAAAFLIFFQAYLVAPLIPALAAQFRSSEGAVALLVPAYMLPYGASSLFYGPISDRIGRRPVLLAMLVLMTVTAVGASTAASVGQLLAWRILAGVASGGIVPISLALFGDLFAYHERGRPLGWIFGAVAGGMAFGSTLGALLNPIVGWRIVFLTVAAACGAAFFAARRHLTRFQGLPAGGTLGLGATFASYWA